MKRDPQSLKAWYRQAMARRIDELRGLRAGLAASDPAACDGVRAVAQALRGSGATFGFPELSDVAGLVETASDAQLRRRVEGLVEHLLAVSADEPGRSLHCEWLVLAAGIEPGEGAAFDDLVAAWREVSRLSGLDGDALAARAAVRLALGKADLERAGRAPLRLVPEALMRRELVLPVAEDSATITVASADPTSLPVERELMRLTGRSPVFVIAPPDALGRTLDALLDHPAASPPAPRRAAAASDGDSGRILLVDDDAGSRLLARTVLEKRGYTVVEAGDGVEALHRLGHEEQVALVVADLNMPHMDGLELIWELRGNSAWAQIPVLVLTGENDEVLEAKLIDEGADDYVCKPLDPRLFLARVKATIRRAGA